MKKLLVTGISGFLGSFIAQQAPKNWTIIGTYNQHKPDLGNVELCSIDLTNKADLNMFLSKIQANAVLHLAANSNPNNCENNPISDQINIDVPTILAQYCAKQGIPFIFTSTDLVFDGNHAPYRPSDKPQPIMRYGQQKAAAEQAILKHYPAATIARMPLLYGLPKNRKGFLSNWLKKLKNGQEIHCFTDEYRTALSGKDAAKGLFLLLKQQKKGVFHLGGTQRMSRYDFAYTVARHFGYDTTLIIPALQKDVKMPAARPADVSLSSNDSFRQIFEPELLETYLKNGL